MPDELDSQFTPEEHLSSDLHNLAIGWQEQGIDPDDFLKCGKCHKWMRDCVSAEDEVVDGVLLPGIPDEDCCSCK
jgi:hypothetical protein